MESNEETLVERMRRVATEHGNPTDVAKYDNPDNKSRLLLVGAETIEHLHHELNVERMPPIAQIASGERKFDWLWLAMVVSIFVGVVDEQRDQHRHNEVVSLSVMFAILIAWIAYFSISIWRKNRR